MISNTAFTKVTTEPIDNHMITQTITNNDIIDPWNTTIVSSQKEMQKKGNWCSYFLFLSEIAQCL